MLFGEKEWCGARGGNMAMTSIEEAVVATGVLTSCGGAKDFLVKPRKGRGRDEVEGDL